jgi:hypothetical protein
MKTPVPVGLFGVGHDRVATADRVSPGEVATDAALHLANGQEGFGICRTTSYKKNTGNSWAVEQDVYWSRPCGHGWYSTRAFEGIRYNGNWKTGRLWPGGSHTPLGEVMRKLVLTIMNRPGRERRARGRLERAGRVVRPLGEARGTGGAGGHLLSQRSVQTTPLKQSKPRVDSKGTRRTMWPQPRPNGGGPPRVVQPVTIPGRGTGNQRSLYLRWSWLRSLLGQGFPRNMPTIWNGGSAAPRRGY